jgi:hypothetical protein
MTSTSPPTTLEEFTLQGIVRAALAAELPTNHAQETGELLQEALLAELLETAPPFITSSLQLAVANAVGVAPGLLGEEEEASLVEGLSKLISSEVAAMEKAAEDARAPAPGCCALCERRMPLTGHHLRPRSQHARLRGCGFSIAELSVVLMVCRQCHNAVHEQIDEVTLASSYFTADLLLAHEGVFAFVRWASKQRSRGDTNQTLQIRR